LVGALAVLIDIAKEAWIGLQTVTHFGFYNRNTDKFVQDLENISKTAKKMSQDLITGGDASKKTADGLAEVDTEANRLIPTIEDAAQAMDRFFNERQAAFSLINQIQGVADAWQTMGEDMSRGNVVDAISSADSLIANFAQNGVDQFNRLRAVAQELFAQGIIDTDMLAVAMGDFDKMEAAAQPFIAAAKNIEEKIGFADTAAQLAQQTLNTGLTPALDTTMTSADRLAASVTSVGDALLSLPKQINILINVGLTGAGAFLITGGGGGLNINASSGGGNTPIGGSSVAIAANGLRDSRPRGDARAASGLRPTPVVSAGSSFEDRSRGAAAAARDSARAARSAANTAKILEDANREARYGKKPGGGGGGGGGGKDRNATIEDIKKFFNEVNAAILSGIRGGKVFSLAGNAIPLGGPGQFVSSQGGTLIEQVNLRGVWDFADPAAKREIIRQLREALKEFGNEVA
jgi:hypothetical protein